MDARTYNAEAAADGIWYRGLPTNLAHLPPNSIELANEVEEFQNKHGITADGKLGPSTYDKMLEVLGDPKNNVDGIYVGNDFEPFPFTTYTYKEDASLRLRSHKRSKRPNLIVLHYDVTFNARSTHKVLQKRGYSSHFCVNHDGHVYQFADPEFEVTYHAGNVNNRSIGIDLNNPADPKYAEQDASKRRGKQRDVVTQRVHGAKVSRLSYFPEQLNSLRMLLRLLNEHIGIPLVYPTHANGKPIYGVYDEARSFSGVVGHYHLTKQKTDPAPLDWIELFSNIDEPFIDTTEPETITFGEDEGLEITGDIADEERS